MNIDDIEKLVNELVDESVYTVANHVNEYIDSSSEQMEKDITDLKKEWIEKLSKLILENKL